MKNTLSRSDRHNADAKKDDAGSQSRKALGATAGCGDAPVGTGSSSNPGVREITLGDLAVLPPVKRAGAGKPMPLPEIEDHLRQIDAKIEDKTLGYHNEVIYDIAADGLLLLKAQAHYVLTSQGETVSPKRRKRSTGGQLVAQEDGFLGWLRRYYCQGRTFSNEAEAERYFQAKKRSAYNHMKLATNNRLTSDHSLDDVEALRVSLALHGRKPTEFYKGQLALENTETDEEAAPQPAVNLAADTIKNVFVHLDQALVLRDTMAAEEYEGLHTRLHATLEKLTGAKWEMVTEQGEGRKAKGDGGRLSNAASGRIAKKGKGALTANDRARIAAQQKARWAKARAAK